MKGIILAGGAGTRMYPMTLAMSKQMLPVYDKPMIYYPLSLLMMARISDILIISTPRDLPALQDLLENGRRFGINIRYEKQYHPDGLAQAFIIGEDFLDGEPACLILGDNIFHGAGIEQALIDAIYGAEHMNEACIFGYEVKDPERYGVLEYEQMNSGVRVISLEEKPKNPKTNYAVPGLYCYPSDVCDKAKSLTPSARNELEITDLNNLYLKEGRLYATLLNRGLAWLDTGTHESLQQASDYIAAVQQRSGVVIACLEEIAYNNGWIDESSIEYSIKLMGKSPYGDYLKTLINK